jgi:cytochrome bd-type quinol oxidase subunit 2
MAETPQKKSFVPTFLAYVAISMGTYAFLQAGMKGHRVGWEEMMLYTAPAVVCALLAIALRRDKSTYLGLVFAALAIVGLVLGA